MKIGGWLCVFYFIFFKERESEHMREREHIRERGREKEREREKVWFIISVRLFVWWYELFF